MTDKTGRWPSKYFEDRGSSNALTHYELFYLTSPVLTLIHAKEILCLGVVCNDNVVRD
jgi:hypothetical protein